MHRQGGLPPQQCPLGGPVVSPLSLVRAPSGWGRRPAHFGSAFPRSLAVPNPAQSKQRETGTEDRNPGSTFPLWASHRGQRSARSVSGRCGFAGWGHQSVWGGGGTQTGWAGEEGGRQVFATTTGACREVASSPSCPSTWHEHGRAPATRLSAATLTCVLSHLPLEGAPPQEELG